MVFGVTGISTPFAFCDGTDGWRPGGICSMADDLGMDKSVIGHIPTANWFLMLELAKKRRVKGITLEVLAALLPCKTAVRANLMTVPMVTPSEWTEGHLVPTRYVRELRIMPIRYVRKPRICSGNGKPTDLAHLSSAQPHIR